MKGPDNQSLLSFIDSPIVVGDPDGHVIFVNPAFEARFCRGAESPQGEHLAALFAGGGREAMLAAVASVCTRGETARFRLREDGGGYLAVASPIQAEGDQVGVVILLTDEPTTDGRFLDFYREIQEPLEEAMGCLEELIDQTGGRRNERFRSVVERGLGAMNRARKWSDELHGLIGGDSAAAAAETLEAVPVLRQVAERMSGELVRNGSRLELMVPPQLPVAQGDGTLLETALVRLIRHRIAESNGAGVNLTLSARKGGEGADGWLLISLVDPGTPGTASGEDEPRVVRETVAVLGGRIQTVTEAEVGRVSVIRLPCA